MTCCLMCTLKGLWTKLWMTVDRNCLDFDEWVRQNGPHRDASGNAGDANRSGEIRETRLGNYRGRRDETT